MPDPFESPATTTTQVAGVYDPGLSRPDSSLPPAGLTDRPTKDHALETLRGLAIVLLVLHHTHDVATPNTNGSVSISAVDHFFQVLRMPLFTAISGYLYAGRPVHPGPGGSLKPLIAGKARRVLLPGAVCLTIMLLLAQAGVPYWLFPAPADFYGVPAFYLERPITYWFLIAIFLVFLFIGALDRTRLLRQWHGWAATLLVAIVVSALLVSKKSFPWLCLGGAVYLLPPFLTGLGVRRFVEPAIHHRPALIKLTHLAVIPFVYVGFYATSAATGSSETLGTGWASAAHQPIFAGLTTAPPRLHTLEVIAGCCAVLWLLVHRRTHRVLAHLGGYAYGIYLFHRLGMWAWDLAVFTQYRQSARIDGPPWLMWLIASVFVLAFAYGTERLLRRAAFTRKWVLGLRG